MSKKQLKGDHFHFQLEHFLPYRLSLLSNTLSLGIAQIYQRNHQLSVPEWRVMAVLGRYPDSTASQVCEWTVMDKVTVSRAVKQLLEKQLIIRITDSSDRRKRPLRISQPKGKTLLDEVIPFALEYQASLLKRLSPEEQCQLDQVIGKLFTAASDLNLQRKSR